MLSSPRTLHLPGRKVEELVKDIELVETPAGQSAHRPDGRIFLSDDRPSNTTHRRYNGTKWVSAWVRPTGLLAAWMRDQSLTVQDIGSIRVIPWPDGKVLVMVTHRNHIFDWWLSLDG